MLGWYAVFLVSGNNTLQVHLPLDEEGRVEPKYGALFYPCKTEWQQLYYGELEITHEKHNLFKWGTNDYSITELGTAPIKKGAMARCWYERSTISGSDIFTVTSLVKL